MEDISVVVRGLVFCLVFPMTLVSCKDDFRLSRYVSPKHYDLRIRTDLESFTFSGTVDIEVDIPTYTLAIILHSKGLKIDRDKVTVNKIPALKVFVPGEDSDTDFLIIKPGGPLLPVSNVVHIPFMGYLDTDQTGFYRSNYMDAAGLTESIAMTHFKPIGARRAFPCFDEPALKAAFTIHIQHKKGLKSLSNMPQQGVSKPDSEGYVWTDFQRSPKMSTHLVSFVVGDLDCTSKSRWFWNKPQYYSICGRPGSSNQETIVTKYIPKFMDWYNDYFGLSYAFPKIDFLAIPNFQHGSAENWGLLIFRENLLLVNELKSGPIAIHKAISVMGREMVRQWYGNLVTMPWWDDHWLDEAFAAYLSNIALNEILPEWDTFDSEIAKWMMETFDLDKIQWSHQMSDVNSINHHREIRQLFEADTDPKGPLLLNMLYSFLGVGVFKTGVAAFLKTNAFLDAKQYFLWVALNKAGYNKGLVPPSETVRFVIESWILQNGYPIITVRRDGGDIIISQTKFRMTPTAKTGVSSDRWNVPISFATKTRPFYKQYPAHWLTCNQPTLRIDAKLGSEDWIIFNKKATGIYRVNYDEKTWELNINYASGKYKNSVPELNKMLLIADYMDFAYSGLVPYKQAIKVLKIAKHSLSYPTWFATSRALDDLQRILYRTDRYPMFQEMVKRVVSEIFSSLYLIKNLPNTESSHRARAFIYQWACIANVGDCIGNAHDRFQRYLEDPNVNRVPPFLRRCVYCEGVRRGDDNYWQFMLNQYKKTAVDSEKQLILNSLACTSNVELLKQLLRMSLDESTGIDKQHAELVFRFVVRMSKEGFNAGLAFLKDKLREIQDHFKPSIRKIAAYFFIVAERMIFKEELNELRQFVADNNSLLKEADTGIAKALERAEENLQWMEVNFESIEKAFRVSF